MPHPLAAYLRTCDFHTALVADRASMADALVLAAVALPVLGRTENLFAEQAAVFRLERAVVDRLRLGDLAVRPRLDIVRRRKSDTDRIEVIDVERPTGISAMGLSHRLHVLLTGSTLHGTTN